MIESIDRYEVTEKLVIDYRSREWCKLPYPDHKNGCPNYGKKAECPPEAPLIKDFIDLTIPHWFIVVKFNILAHIKRMKEKHPMWSDRQAKCVLYWQGTVRKTLRDECLNFCRSSNRIFTLLPEAMGVQVIQTAKKIGIPIEVKPKEFIHKIALIGYSNNTNKGIMKFM